MDGNVWTEPVLIWSMIQDVTEIFVLVKKHGYSCSCRRIFLRRRYALEYIIRLLKATCEREVIHKINQSRRKVTRKNPSVHNGDVFPI